MSRKKKKLLCVGDKAPDFALPDQYGETRSLKDFLGSWLLVYFYPKDNTPGCTTEAKMFQERYREFKNKGINIVGVSADGITSHHKFAKKLGIEFPLLSDQKKEMIFQYGAWGEKKFMGKTFQGILRISYLINPEGVIAAVYEQVKPKDHPSEVLADFEVISSNTT